MKKHRNFKQLFSLALAMLILFALISCGDDTTPSETILPDNPPASATLATPSNIAIVSGGILDFLPVEGATHYEVEFEGKIISIPSGGYELPQTDGKLRVRAVNKESGTVSEWSEYLHYDALTPETPTDPDNPQLPSTPDTPSPVSLGTPTGLKIVDGAYLDFLPVEHATAYEIEFDGSLATVADKGGIALPRYSVTIRVRAINRATGAASEWSEPLLYLPEAAGEDPEEVTIPVPTFTVSEFGELQIFIQDKPLIYELEINNEIFRLRDVHYQLEKECVFSVRALEYREDVLCASEWSEPYRFTYSDAMRALIPEFSFNPTNRGCHVIINNVDKDALYEINVNNGVSHYTGDMVEQYLFDYDVPIRIRLLAANGTVLSPWSEWQTATRPVVNVSTPTAFVDRLGHIQATVSNMDPDNIYRLYLQYDGTDNTYEVQLDGSTQINPHRSAKLWARAITPSGYMEDSDSVPLIYKPETVIFDQTTNPIQNFVKLEEGSYLMTAVSTSGKEYVFRLDGEVLPVANGWGSLTPGSRFYSLDALHGSVCFDYAGTDNDYLELFSRGYMLDGKDRIEHYDDMDIWFHAHTAITSGGKLTDYLPNFYCLFNDKEATGDAAVDLQAGLDIDRFSISFTGEESVLDHATTHDFFHVLVYLPGSPFSIQNPDHLLCLYFKNGDQMTMPVDMNKDATFVALMDADGNIIQDPENHYLQKGDMARLRLTDTVQMDVPLVKDMFLSASSPNEIRPNTFTQTTGTINALVVPIYWSDHADRATPENMNLIHRALGNVLDENGKVTIYAPMDPTEPSLSEYYRISSFGKLDVRAFVTDWYAYDAPFSEKQTQGWAGEYHDILAWVKATYPTLDMTQFDLDRDGIVDEIIFINTGDASGTDGYDQTSFSGAYRTVNTYGTHETNFDGTPEDPGVYHYINLTLGFLFEDRILGSAEHMVTETLIHEFAHSLGIWDYYDTAYKGTFALGGYDLQDQNNGDWNVFSKFVAGWITPTVVREQDFSASDTVEFTLRSSTLSGDALLIPAAGYSYNGTPYDEYVMIDLFTPQGLHEKDSAQFGLTDAGVRIYHVNNKKILYTTKDDTYPGSVLDYGVRQHSNDGQGVWHEEFDMHQLEIISSTGKNHFTGKDVEENRVFDTEDLFVAGDTFSTEGFTEFFYKGKMDSGMTLGYTLTVKSIEQIDGEYVATVALTRTAD